MRLLTIALFLFLFIFIRSINFSEHLNFSFDQAWASTRTLEIWRNKEFTLVGPGSSIIVRGKQMLQGSINYYFQLFFLVLGKFDPILSSYLFMLFSAMMIIPLFYGVEFIFNQKVALFAIVIYTLLPLYIDFTRFFFGPGFQFSLVPVLLLSMGLYKKTERPYYLFLVFFMVGVISQFHFATLIFFPIFFIYFIAKQGKYSPREQVTKLQIIIFSFSGFLLGFAPIILFELKNKFYNLNILVEYFKYAKSLSNFELLPHRYLSLSLVLLIFMTGYFKKYVNYKLIVITVSTLLLIDLFLYLPRPKNAFGMAENWNYIMEKKAYEIIRHENSKDFNVANLIYDNLSVVIKYQMKKDNYYINFDDYYHNKFLFVIDKNEKNISKNPAYEITTFTPRKKIKQWKLNDFYNLYLFERVKNGQRSF